MRRGFILQPTYELRRRRPVVQLFGRLEEGDPFLVEDTRFRPYFHAGELAEALLRDARQARVSPSTARDFAGRPVVRIEVDLPARVPELREKLRADGVEVFEADVRFAYLYLIDHGLRASVDIDGECERQENGVLLFRDPSLSAGSFHPELSVLSIDIETSPDAKRVYSAALYGAGADEVHLVSEKPVAGARHHASEALLLWTVQERIRALDPDVITGWNVVDFDLRVLARRAEQLGVAFRLGRADRPLRFHTDPGFTRQSRVEVPGRQVLDGIGLVRDASIKLDDYRLETAAQALVGRGKLIEGHDRGGEIDRLYREDPPALVAYNREDAKLVLDILEKESLVELAVERSLLTGMQLDRVGASIASFDLVYLPELRRHGRVAPSVRSDRKSARLTGGAVLDSSPGFFSNVGVFDFKSLYPSLMRTFNLDPLACADGPSEADALVAPNGARFSRREAILPAVLESFGAQREAAKLRADRHADYAIKILMNSFYGVLGAGSCRFFEPDVANAITGFGQQILGWTRDAFDARDVQVLYGDTDSVFVALGPPGGGDLESARTRAASLLAIVQHEISQKVEQTYAVESRLELELELIYERFFQPTVRGGTQGSKKRYAGLVGGAVRVVGLEAVRRDWPQVARRLQIGLLERVFRDEDPVPFLRQVVAGVRSGELDRELVIRKGLRKGSVDRYTDRMPPHVEAARRAGDLNARVVHYVLTPGGPEPVGAGRPFPKQLDTGHYVEKVLRPIAVSILEPLGTSWEEALDLPRQLSLL